MRGATTRYRVVQFALRPMHPNMLPRRHLRRGNRKSILRFINKRTNLDSDAYGFLTPTGCGIKIGRPTVCYEYFCYDHLYYQPDEVHEKVMRVLGVLPAHATRNAIGDAPLSEILQEE